MKNTFEIRKTKAEELEEVMHIYACARKFMAETGNPFQWKNHKPSEQLVAEDIKKGISYVCTEADEILGVFAFIPGKDPTYSEIYGGAWLSDEPYCTVHRIASSGKKKGVGTFMLNWAFSCHPNIRIDTHRDNSVMQNMLRKLGYSYCGIIHLEDGDERLAFQKVLSEVKI